MVVLRNISRRSVVSGGITLFGSLAARVALGQPFSPNAQRVAVVIGLDKYPGLQQLRAAVSGAEQMADFLGGEGFEVLSFTDRPDPGNAEPKLVRAYEIADTIEALVNRGTLEQLVIYFSGHGTMSGTSEYWLLSKADTQPSEAISVQDTMFLARLSGIPNVVLISDACRSVASSLNLTAVQGQSIFPSSPNPSGHVDVDTFYAALPGNPALELPVEESVAQHEGIFTTAFLKAFQEPDRDMIYTLDNGVNVVPNRRLRNFLVREVQARAQARSIRLNQMPDAMVMSDLPMYVARASRPPDRSPEVSKIDISSASVGNAMDALLQHVAGPTNTTSTISQIESSVSSAAQREAGRLVIDNADRQTEDLILPGTGIAVYGGQVAEITLGPGSANVQPERIVETGSAEGWRVPVTDVNAISALVTFSDGSGCAVALLRDFGLHITLDTAGISDMRYNPTEESYLFHDFLDAIGYETGSPGELAFLRGLAAEAKRQGVLRFEGTIEERTEAANRFAGRIRMGKGMDATLGIYAAYAYALAFLEDGARSVHEIMKGDLGVALFDTALTAGTLLRDCDASFAPVVPAAPMMRQGWEMLRARGVALPPAFLEARPALRDSLWTTFRPDGMEILRANAAGILDDAACRAQLR